MSDEYTKEDLMILSGARELRDDDVGLIGVGMPLLSEMVAKRTHAPNLKSYVEIGLGEPSPVEETLGIGDVRTFHNPTLEKSWTGVMMQSLQRGDIDIGFLGAIQVDQYGNVNTTLVGDKENPKRRFGGSGGGSDIAICADRFMIILPLEKRRFPEKVDYITSPGFVDGNGERDEYDMPGGGPEMVITDKALFDFDEDEERMRLYSVHPGESIEDIEDSVGFDLIVPDDVQETPEPTDEELRALEAVRNST